jgi:hypothetical protein
MFRMDIECTCIIVGDEKKMYLGTQWPLNADIYNVM